MQMDGQFRRNNEFYTIGNVTQCGVKDENRNKIIFMFIETK
jgi:hypothetical protein